MIRLRPLPALSDNYIWFIDNGSRALVVDPGEAAPVLTRLSADGLQLDAVLVTHHHADHIGGIAELTRKHPAPVLGPRADAARIPQLTQLLDDGDRVQRLGLDFQLLFVPGHTHGHIAYYAPTLGADSAPAGALFCGDALFSAGCGRLFEGAPEQAYASLQRLAALPDDTLLCCTHEYTLANLAFAAAVEPGNADVRTHIETVRALRERGEPSLPSTLGLERRINPYLRCALEGPRRAALEHGAKGDAPMQVFAALRRWKDGFRA